MVIEVQALSEQSLSINQIEQVQLVHIPLIHTQLVKIGKSDSSDDIAKIIQSPENSVFIEANKEIVCRIRHDLEKQENHVDWLLPQNELKVELYLVMCEALMDISSRFPQDDNFVTQARFKTNRGCLTILGGEQDFAQKAVRAFHGLF